MPVSRLFSRRSDLAAAMPFIMLTVLIDMVSIGLIVPVLPAMVGSFTSSQADQAFWFGVVMVAYGFANFLGAPVLGALSDSFGRRPVLLLGFCGLGLNLFATGFATALWVLIAVRLVGGALQANAAVANAYVADITPPEGRAKRFGLLGAMFGVGFIIGPMMGGSLGAIDLRLPFFVGGGLAVLNLLYGCLVLPESLPRERRRPFRWGSISPFASLRVLARLRGVGWLVVVVALNALSQFLQFTSWVLFTSFKFGWGPQENGWSLAAVGVMAVLVQGVLLGRLLRRFSPQYLALAGLVSSTLACIGFGAASDGWMIYAVIGANVLGYAVTASIQSLISAAADGRTQGQALGALNSLNSLAAVVAPILGTVLLPAVSHFPRGDWRLGLPMYFCALLQGVALLLYLLYFRQHRRAARG